MPDGKFSIYDLRIFGRREGAVPAIVNNFTIEFNESDPRKARIEWPKDSNATGHIVNYGTYVLVWIGLVILTGITITAGKISYVAFKITKRYMGNPNFNWTKKRNCKKTNDKKI